MRTREWGSLVAIVVAALLAGCATGGSQAPAPPARLEGLRTTSAVEHVDLERLAAEAMDVAALDGLLESAGFLAATERTYAGVDPEIRRVVVRVVRFDSLGGAERYLRWLREHASEVIGDAEPAPGHPYREAPVYIHEPGGCCPKEAVVALSVWRSGRDVIRVLVAGPGADGRAASSVFAALAGSMSPGP